MPDQSPFTLHTAVSGTGAVITLSGALDLVSTAALARALDNALARLRETRPPSLVLDLAGVEFLDVAAARVIAAAAWSWTGPGGLVIRDPSPVARRVLQVTGLDAALNLSETAADQLTRDGARPAPPAGQQAGAALGPGRLAALLHTPVADLYRAGELGLLPQPRADGQWPPDSVAEIARGWPQTTAAIQAARELGAVRSAELLAKVTGLPVTAAHVTELAARGLLTSARSYKRRPLYRVADLHTLAADPTTLDLLTQITTPARANRR